MITPMTRIALASQRGKTTVVRRGRMPGVGLTRRAGLATGVGRDSNALIRATNPTHVESIGTVISTKPDRNKKRGGSGMISNGGSQAATLATLVRVGSVDLTTEDLSFALARSLHGGNWRPFDLRLCAFAQLPYRNRRRAVGRPTCCANLNSVRIWASSKSLFFDENRVERQLPPSLRASLNREASR